MRKGDGSVPPTPPEEKKKLLAGWSIIVQKECDDIIAERDKKLERINKMKSRYDGWISQRMRWVNKLEKRLVARKTQLKEIQDELAALETLPPTP